MFERRTERLRHVHGRLCSETATSPANPASDGRTQKHAFSLSLSPSHQLLYSRPCPFNAHSRKWRGHREHGRSSSMENSHGALRPRRSRYQLPDQNHRKPTQETVSHNRAAMLPPKKHKVTKSQLNATLHPLYTLEKH